ncbi:glycoside hydrolase 15-related protein [Sulfobacillus acidophilus TPY]|uniref:Glycoside hydrolase 15-related protein n=1 Tax=Sulfobacillus acidophilus (strain ATCC 700253 / DSM 10332 / NAL) TaxID=679936 RepID=G8TYY0_SULAD|nr:glycoside hydrolase 15-related protein [Sulfobacillus acidophilus TPY]AEW05159.1 glycoside hydrolase 15-related protein [Sulfobacillus acidophilus DSM 10332]
MKPFYAILANGSTAALAGPTGAIDWLPIPRFDGETIFGRLLDWHTGGYLSLEPDQYDQVEQSYLSDGLCLETRFYTQDGIARVRSWMSVGRTAVWLACETPVPLRLTCRPAFGYGAVRPAYYPTSTGMRYQNPKGPEQAQLAIQGPFQTTHRIDQWTIGPGQATIVLRVTTEEPADVRWLTRPIPNDPERLWERTAGYWQAGRVAYEGPHAQLLTRSLDILRALTYRPTGAPIAAATTSLPEIPGEARQWDYRYVWVRDSAYAAEALLLAGDMVAARRIAEFLLNAVSPTERVFPAPFLRVDGTLPDGERDLLWLQGHDESRPARAGNGAISQLQLDLAGSVLWLVYHLWQTEHNDGWIRYYWWAIESLAEWARHTWTQEDASLWEYRTIRSQHTHSRLMNWVGLKAAAELAQEVLGAHESATRWARVAQRIQDTMERDAAKAGEFTPRPGSESADAALLTLPLYGFIDARHPWFERTLERIENTLVDQDLVYRYREDDLGTARYPFLLAGFWYARVLMRQGRREDADRVIARHAAQATPLGLYGEHVELDTGRVRGNFPQLFSHTGLITTLMERQRLEHGQPLLSWSTVSLF